MIKNLDTHHYDKDGSFLGWSLLNFPLKTLITYGLDTYDGKIYTIL